MQQGKMRLLLRLVFRRRSFSAHRGVDDSLTVGSVNRSEEASSKLSKEMSFQQ